MSLPLTKDEVVELEGAIEILRDIRRDGERMMRQAAATVFFALMLAACGSHDKCGPRPEPPTREWGMCKLEQYCRETKTEAEFARCMKSNVGTGG